MAIEDRRFYSHFGVDPIGVARAMFSNVTRRRMREGASTLTQQLAKNLFLTQERTLERKLQELVLAFWLERKFSKDQIIDLYLNRVYFGAGAYGVEAASQRYFGKSARQVTMAEAALLAGLVQSPSRLAPTRNPEGAAKRAQVVVAAMAGCRLHRRQDGEDALRPIRRRSPRRAVAGSAGYVADWVMDVLDDLIGRFENDIVVETTIDPRAADRGRESADRGTRRQGREVRRRAGRAGRDHARTAPCARWSAARTMRRASSTAPSRRGGSRAPSFKAFVFLTALERAGLTPETHARRSPDQHQGLAAGKLHARVLSAP